MAVEHTVSIVKKANYTVENRLPYGGRFAYLVHDRCCDMCSLTRR